jgi:hypothetical protein
VIVHIEAGWRVVSASIERPDMRSAHQMGPCDMKRTSVTNALASDERTDSRNSLRRSRESRSAAGAGRSRANDTVVLLKVQCAFRKSDKDLDQSVSSFRRCRAMTIRWISEVPSPISQILASRIMRSTG